MIASKEAILAIINDCINACDACYAACLQEENAQAMADCIISDRECSDVCRLTAQFVATDSRFSDKILQLCREVCLNCEQVCRKHHHDHCQRCADACHQCHLACEEYVRLTV